ncbi:MAG TPA: adenylate/guanylate cyclase domain-containing protein, partial [Gammaproteobacteria bacterium]
MKQQESLEAVAAESALIDDVADWLMASALGETGIEDVFGGCCERLRAADIPISRASLGFRTLHPLFRHVTLVWHLNETLEKIEHPHGPVGDDFRKSPYHHMIKRNIPLLRRRLSDDNPTLDFPVLAEFKEGGGTDYLAYLFPFGGATEDPLDRDGVIGSWLCDRPGGFRDADIKVLRRIQRRLAVVCKVSIKDQIARNILDAYLGRHAGKMVHEGSIRRGSGERIHAVIWFTDLRGSTQLSKDLPLEEFLAVLNAFFESVADAVLDRGGEVLRFIGDAALAIFPMQDHTMTNPSECPVHQAVCGKAMAAAEDAIRRMNQLNEDRASESKKPLGFGIGLHVGDVMYGNIGVPRRVEFSVVGHAANHAAKMESLCKQLNVPLLVSREFAEIHQRDWADLGEYGIDGGGPQHIFTLP